MPTTFYYKDTLITLGQNQYENTELIKQSDPSYIWLHLNSVSSGHIVINSDKIDNDVIDYAAHCCFSAVSKNKQKLAMYQYAGQQYFDIVVTKVRNLIFDTPYLSPGEVEFIKKPKIMKINHNYNLLI